MAYHNTKKNSFEIAVVDTIRVGEKNITKISMEDLANVNVQSSLADIIGTKKIETVVGSYCSIVKAVTDRNFGEYATVFLIDENSNKKLYIDGPFVVTGYANMNGGFDDLDVDEEWIDDRILLTVYKEKPKKEESPQGGKDRKGLC